VTFRTPPAPQRPVDDALLAAVILLLTFVCVRAIDGRCRAAMPPGSRSRVLGRRVLPRRCRPRPRHAGGRRRVLAATSVLPARGRSRVAGWSSADWRRHPHLASATFRPRPRPGSAAPLAAAVAAALPPAHGFPAEALAPSAMYAWLAQPGIVVATPLVLARPPRTPKPWTVAAPCGTRSRVRSSSAAS
jgi:hypothetical protein